MKRILTAAAAVMTLIAWSGHPAQAHGNHPWCAVYNLGWGDAQWECDYDSIEACRPNILAGNRGFCNPNPAYGPQRRFVPRHSRR